MTKAILSIAILATFGGDFIRPTPEIPERKLEIRRDVYCYQGDNVIGSILAGTVFNAWTEGDDWYKVVHPKYQLDCYITRNATVEPWPIDEYTLNAVVQWWDYAQEAGEYYGIDPVLILAVIGKESKGQHRVVSSDGYASVGLMQVIRRSYGCSSSDLLDVYPRVNIYCGSLILQDAIRQAQEDIDAGYIAPNGFEPKDAVRVGLAAYNCGFASLYGTNGKSCLSFGGLAYADDILDFWYLVIDEYLEYKELKNE